jgi:serine/threonine-protein kinase
VSADPYIGREILGQFKILERIGTGGMGSVYKAEQPAMDRLVAVKILHPKLAVRRDLVSRFRREARAMSHLTHPNTVRVFLYGQLDDGSLYIVMEFLEGRNLAQLVRAEGPMDPQRAVGVVIQACGALEEAHRQGIIHRDLKPENIFLTRPGGIEDYAKVLDFGLAKVTQREMRPGSLILTQEGMVFGTPEFMSPEQAQGKTLDARSDIYSLGIILYELVTGKLPFDAKVPMEFINLHVTTKPIPLADRAPGRTFPPDLQKALDKALAKDPEDRFQTAAEFAAGLKAIFPDKGLTGAMRAVPPSGIGPTRPAMDQPGAKKEEKIDETRASDASTGPVPRKKRIGSTVLLILGGLLVFAASFALFATVAGSDSPPADAGPATVQPVVPVPMPAPVTATP